MPLINWQVGSSDTDFQPWNSPDMQLRKKARDKSLKLFDDFTAATLGTFTEIEVAEGVGVVTQGSSTVAGFNGYVTAVIDTTADGHAGIALPTFEPTMAEVKRLTMETRIKLSHIGVTDHNIHFFMGLSNAAAAYDPDANTTPAYGLNARLATTYKVYAIARSASAEIETASTKTLAAATAYVLKLNFYPSEKRVDVFKDGVFAATALLTGTMTASGMAPVVSIWSPEGAAQSTTLTIDWLSVDVELI